MAGESPILEAALTQRLITRKQYDTVVSQLRQNPGLDAETVLLQHRYLTKGQLSRLGGRQTSFEDSRPPARAVPQPTASPSPAMRHPPATPTAQPVRTSRPDAAAPRRSAADLPAPPRKEDVVEEQVATDDRGQRDSTAEDTSPHHTPSGHLEAQPSTLKGLLRLARHWGCSDLYLAVGSPPMVRLHGTVRFTEMEPLTAAVAERLAFSMLTEQMKSRIRENKSHVFALEIAGLGRHRAFVFHEREGWGASYRIIPSELPVLGNLGFPGPIHSLAEYRHGLLLVCGPSSSGRSTTAAALLGHVARQQARHLQTIEDPIEFVYSSQEVQASQREIGTHTDSYESAVRSVLKEDTDVLFLGEIRDWEVASLALDAAESGLFVIGLSDAVDAESAVRRLAWLAPSEERIRHRERVGGLLRAVLAQDLVPRLDGQGLIPAIEILLVTPGIETLLRQGSYEKLTGILQAGQRFGMISMDQSLRGLVSNGIISPAQARLRAHDRASFDDTQQAGV